MTGKAAAKKRVSPAELKRQAASHKQQSDNSAALIGELTSLVKQSLARTDEIAAQVKELQMLPTKSQLLQQHDPAEQVINRVLREEFEDKDVPEKPEVHLPDTLLQVGRAFDAKNAPVARQYEDTVDTGEHDIGQYQERVMRNDGPARESLAPLRLADEGIILENKPWTKEKYEMEMFMQELVLVRVHDTTDETQIPVPVSINNGVTQHFIRGKAQWVKRMAIEPLARSKKTTYTQRKIRQENGDEVYIQIPHTALMYPFEVMQDSPKGKQWLRQILAEAY